MAARKNQKHDGDLARITVSVPASLRDEMRQFGTSTNWSAVTVEAIRAEITRIRARRRVSNMDEVVDRLRASKAETLREELAETKELGKEWARHNATYAELRNLEGHYGHKVTSGYTDYKEFGDALFGTDDWHESELNDMIAGNFPMMHPEPEHFAAFVDGALLFWGWAKDQL